MHILLSIRKSVNELVFCLQIHYYIAFLTEYLSAFRLLDLLGTKRLCCCSAMLVANVSCLVEQVIVVSGETGCGKTTQLPQYILESEIDAARGATCSIICTQPRRISAIAVSERVAAERGEKIGESVSYLYLQNYFIFKWCSPRLHGSIWIKGWDRSIPI